MRIGFDMDGVLADFASAFHEVEARLYPDSSGVTAGQPEAEAASGTDETEPKSQEPADPYEARRRRTAIWSEIKSTPDFWTTLQPMEQGAVRRVHELMLRHRWEVFFITQRPSTDGDTVQRQTQRWLFAQGFDLPSVLVIPGSRGAAAAALALDYHADDSPQNCVDVLSAAGSKPVLISDGSDQMAATARNLGIAIAPSIGRCLDLLDRVSSAASNPTLLKRLAARVGWR